VCACISLKALDFRSKNQYDLRFAEVAPKKEDIDVDAVMSKNRIPSFDRADKFPQLVPRDELVKDGEPEGSLCGKEIMLRLWGVNRHDRYRWQTQTGGSHSFSADGYRHQQQGAKHSKCDQTVSTSDMSFASRMLVQGRNLLQWKGRAGGIVLSQNGYLFDDRSAHVHRGSCG